MKTFQAGDLRVEVRTAPKSVQLIWLGQSNTRDPGALMRPLFDEVATLLSKDRSLELDFRDFEYMNSSSFRPILTFVQSASKSASGVNIRYDAQKNWQRLSFKTLQAVSASLGNVCVEG